ncbi:hypothetical protein BDZ89DRAFT_1257131 [Hymenopellis radicata]|nr:hypothetical protein BDZ89DRAFT_1257131 [Hymenopellis radicata]
MASPLDNIDLGLTNFPNAPVGGEGSELFSSAPPQGVANTCGAYLFHLLTTSPASTIVCCGLAIRAQAVTWHFVPEPTRSNHSESHLGVQATLIHERNNSFAVPQEAVGTAENAVNLLQYNDFAGTGSALAPTSWPTPPLTLPPALNSGLSSQGEATWDRETVLPVEGINSTYLTAPASHVDMQPYNYSSSSPMYSAEVQHSEGLPPSEPLTDYSSPCNAFGLVGQSSDSSQPNYESLTLPNLQPSLNYDRHTTNPDQDQIIIVFGEHTGPQSRCLTHYSCLTRALRLTAAVAPLHAARGPFNRRAFPRHTFVGRGPWSRRITYAKSLSLIVWLTTDVVILIPTWPHLPNTPTFIIDVALDLPS